MKTGRQSLEVCAGRRAEKSTVGVKKEGVFKTDSHLKRPLFREEEKLSLSSDGFF